MNFKMKSLPTHQPIAAGLATIRRLATPEIVLLLGVFLLALALRLAWIAYANPDPGDGRFDDTVFYDQSAQALAAGKGFIGLAHQQTAQWPPGYSLVLAAVYKVFGHSIIAAKPLNALAGGAACLLIYAVAAKVFNRRVGLLAALIFALFPSSIYFSTLLLTESIFTAVVALLLLLVLMWALERKDGSPLRAFILGVLFGAAALLRAEAPALLLAVLVVWRLAVPSWRAFVPPAGFLIAGAVLAVAPWTVRNAITMHRFIPISTGAGHTLLQGQQDDPYGSGRNLPQIPLLLKYADLPFPERETRVQDEALREALHFAFSHPAYEVQIAFEKFYHLYRDDSSSLEWIRGGWLHASEIEWLKDMPIKSLDDVGEPVVTISPGAEERWSFLADGYYYTVMTFAIAGAPLWFSVSDKKRLLLVLFVASWTLVHLVFLPNTRYHTPLMPIFCLWAAVALIASWDRLVAAIKARPRSDRI